MKDTDVEEIQNFKAVCDVAPGLQVKITKEKGTKTELYWFNNPLNRLLNTDVDGEILFNTKRWFEERDFKFELIARGIPARLYKVCFLLGCWCLRNEERI
jgi:hypothetical protein